MLCVAAARFDLPSETFIRDHTRSLAPGRTVLVCQHADATAGLASSVLADMASPFPASRVAGLAHRARKACGLVTQPGLFGHDRRRVADFLRAHGVSVVLAEYGTTAVQLVGPGRDAGVPLFAHFHGFDATTIPRQWKWRRRYRQLFASAAGVIAVSRFIADRLARLGCPAHKLHVVPCGIDPTRFRPSDPQHGRILAVGRLTEKKAPDLTLRSFARVREREQDAHLDIVGDGPLRSRCEELARELGVTDAVVFHGARPPAVVAELMQTASMFVQHSVTAPSGDMEGLPVAILEAMASGLPVVSTRHSGIPEAVSDGETGRLVEERDVEGMADAMIELLRDPDRAAAMGRAGRDRVLAHFTQDRTAARLREIMGLEALPDAGPGAGYAA